MARTAEPAPVTVAVVNWNYGRWLPYAIASIFAQTRKPADWYVVDDGSDDDSYWTFYQLQARHVHRRSRRGGQQAAFNDALRLCRTPWLVFLDADDELDPEYLEKLLNAARATGQIKEGMSMEQAIDIVMAHVPRIVFEVQNLADNYWDLHREQKQERLADQASRTLPSQR